VQIGYLRAGWYGYDWIDNEGLPSADHIVPEWQDLKMGDMIPGAPGVSYGWRVVALLPNRALVLALPDTYESEIGRLLQYVAYRPSQPLLTWTFVLTELEREHTRLLIRYRARTRRSLLARLFRSGGTGAFILTRKTLLGIRQRAECVSGPGKVYYVHTET
jgi:hypothetical protein